MSYFNSSRLERDKRSERESTPGPPDRTERNQHNEGTVNNKNKSPNRSDNATIEAQLANTLVEVQKTAQQAELNMLKIAHASESEALETGEKMLEMMRRSESEVQKMLQQSERYIYEMVEQAEARMQAMIAEAKADMQKMVNKDNDGVEVTEVKGEEKKKE